MRRIAPLVLVALGVLLLADAALTVAWQEPVSSAYARVQQSRLYAELRQARLDAGLDVERLTFQQVDPGAAEPDRKDLARRARAFGSTVHEGQAIGELRIARMDLRRWSLPA